MIEMTRAGGGGRGRVRWQLTAIAEDSTAAIEFPGPEEIRELFHKHADARHREGPFSVVSRSPCVVELPAGVCHRCRQNFLAAVAVVMGVPTAL